MCRTKSNPRVNAVGSPILLSVTALAVLLCPSSGISRPRAADDQLPKAELVLDWYVDATGGMAAYDRINNRLTKSTLEIAGTGITLPMTHYQAKPNKAYMIVDSTATGKIESGTDGDVVWDMSALSGPQTKKEGIERANFLHLNTIDRLAYWRKSYKQVETVGVEDVSGKFCYEVLATPQEAAPQTLFFDKDSHLLLKVTMTIESAAGKVPVESYLSDYKPADGVLLSRKTVMKLMGQERIATVQSVEQNVDLPADRFDLPAEIKVLAKKNP